MIYLKYEKVSFLNEKYVEYWKIRKILDYRYVIFIFYFRLKKIHIYIYTRCNRINSFDNSCLLFHYCSSALYFSRESLLVESKLGKRVKKPTGYMPNVKRWVVDWISKLCDVYYSRMQIVWKFRRNSEI